jgi:hypothetical protein
MFYTFEQFLNHQKRFYHAFIDLKREGWDKYSKAFDEYTLGYWKSALNEADQQVHKTAETLKTNFDGHKK